MKAYPLARITMFAAASLLLLSTSAYAAGGKDGGRDRGGNRDSAIIWKDHENGCAVGNKPPPGANCTNRNDNR